MNVGKGITVEERDGLVIISFPADGNFGQSGSGKSNIVATTAGNVTLPSGITIGVNAYRKVGA